METPEKIQGFAFGIVEPPGDCNWWKCWALPYSKDNHPFLIQLPDESLWLVPHEQPPGTWGSVAPNQPKPRPDTTGWLGPFDTFEEGWVTFLLSIKE